MNERKKYDLLALTQEISQVSLQFVVCFKNTTASKHEKTTGSSFVFFFIWRQINQSKVTFSKVVDAKKEMWTPAKTGQEALFVHSMKSAPIHYNVIASLEININCSELIATYN